MQRTTGQSPARLAAMLILIILIGLSASPASAPAQAVERWQPGAETTWQIKLSNPPTAGEIARAGQFQAYDVDLFETSKAKIADIKAHDTAVICYFSAGSRER